MPVVSTAYVKNIIRRGFSQLVDPGPDAAQQLEIWRFFNSNCAYCGILVEKRRKEGHIDHLLSAAEGGANHISNRVLSCAPCNEKEKRDLPWEAFLRSKAPDEATYTARRSRILEWRDRTSGHTGGADPELVALASHAAAEVTAFFDQKVAEIRSRRGARNRSSLERSPSPSSSPSPGAD